MNQQLFYPTDEGIKWDNHFQKQFGNIYRKVDSAQIWQIHSQVSACSHGEETLTRMIIVVALSQRATIRSNLNEYQLSNR